jgi:tRNA G37 N-methylase TrmD
VGGNHGEIARYRHEQSLARTRQRRPDLLGRSPPPEGPVDEAGVSQDKTLPARSKAPHR